MVRSGCITFRRTAVRLQSVRDGRVYASDGRDVLFSDGGPRFVQVGRLPLPGGGRDALINRVLTSPRLRSVTTRIVGAVSTVNIWSLPGADLLATVGRQLFVSDDGGGHWEPSHRLPESSGPMGVLPPAVAYRDGITYLGEYPLDNEVMPRILASSDCGRSWSVLTSLPDVRHVHAVQLDPYSSDLWVTTGDTDSESCIGRLHDGTFEVVGGGSQRWRAVELALTPSAVLWGMDCAYADAHRIFKLPREELDKSNPRPEPVHQVPGSVYFSATFRINGEQWVAFSTAMETGLDSTGPATQKRWKPARGVVVAASSASEYSDWHKIVSFRRRQCLTDRLPGGLPGANGYIFLEADHERGLLVNPYNTAFDDGTIRQFPPDHFADEPRPFVKPS